VAGLVGGGTSPGSRVGPERPAAHRERDPGRPQPLRVLPPHVFDAPALEIAAILAIHATSALEQAKLVAGLRSAMQSRHVIGIAQGVLAVRYGIAYDTAFDVLRRLSNDLNVKLKDLAQQVADQRGLPDEANMATGRPPLPPV